MKPINGAANDASGRTPLLICLQSESREGHVECIDLLIQAGADPDAAWADHGLQLGHESHGLHLEVAQAEKTEM